MRPSATEPSEKIHVFLLAWRSQGAELKVKDRSFVEAEGGHCVDNEGKMNSFLPIRRQWEEKFARVQRQWEGDGMEAKSLHLKFHRFP